MNDKTRAYFQKCLDEKLSTLPEDINMIIAMELERIADLLQCAKDEAHADSKQQQGH